MGGGTNGGAVSTSSIVSAGSLRSSHGADSAFLGMACAWGGVRLLLQATSAAASKRGRVRIIRDSFETVQCQAGYLQAARQVSKVQAPRGSLEEESGKDVRFRPGDRVRSF